jgi:hypothetical protein
MRLLLATVLSAATGYTPTPFAQLAHFSPADLRGVSVELAYVGPTRKLVPTVDLTAGPNPYTTAAILDRTVALPPEGVRQPFRVTPPQLARILAVAAAMQAAPTQPGVRPLLGIYAVQGPRQLVAALPLGSARARALIARLEPLLPSAAARTDLADLETASVG